MPKKRILFCYVQFGHYRVPIWNELCKTYDVTVLHASTVQTDGKENFREISDPPKRFWKFNYQKKLLREVRHGNYDAIIFLYDLAWLSHFLGFFMCPSGSRRLTWGFWETKNELANKIRLWIAKRADGNIFYATGAAKYFLNQGLNSSKIWIARNTTEVEPAERDTKQTRDTFLFLGSFNSRKENEIAIAAFNDACSQIPDYIQFVLVGDGTAKAAALEQVAALSNSHRFEFHEGTLDDNKIKNYYARAIASVSFGQAGLSVLQSFGHGVPFITKEGAISGGEIENIISGETGVICEPTQNGLQETFITLCNNPKWATKLGQQALNYYETKSTKQIMAAGFSEAVENIHQITERIS